LRGTVRRGATLVKPLVTQLLVVDEQACDVPRSGTVGGPHLVALAVAQAVASADKKTLEIEAEEVERRIEGRLDELDLRLARIEEELRSLADVAWKLRR
jgi:hypothetical protein